MSVEELRARIAAIDNEIELQKKLFERLVENLEADKKAVQRQLNAALDPIAHLPLEISSDIFRQSHALRRVPTVILNVCNAWTEIALATPALWTTIHVDLPCGDEFAEVLLIWFQRARNLPLSVLVSIRGSSSNWNHRVSDVLWRLGGQLKHLEISDDGDFTLDDESQTIDLFGDITSVSLPLLQTLTIRYTVRDAQ
ncbi:F-box domain-containing protein [Mycena sanguinolenta]|uniref:F-box domain-containing protein n=1 Tax=Mycena sanguinolenta TaxID=230812 RepID=A0A8H7DKC7_9AGAR|nr:F-box domain-containing protein [Mycena sanguinolenta]